MSALLDARSPWETLRAWWPDAVATEPRVAEAAQLATVGPTGRPSVRTVLVKVWNPDDGFVFFTNYTSRKAEEIDAGGQAALLLHWKATARQVVVEGPTRRTEAGVSDAYFASRPRGSQIGAWASDQSSPLAARADLEARIAEIEARFAGREVTRPPFWGGYRLEPARIELWQGQPDRLHDRVEWTHGADGWSRRLLYP